MRTFFNELGKLVKKHEAHLFFNRLSNIVLLVFLTLAVLASLYFINALTVLFDLALKTIVLNGVSWVSVVVSTVLAVVVITLVFFALIAKRSLAVLSTRCWCVLTAKLASNLASNKAPHKQPMLKPVASSATRAAKQS